MTYPLHPQKNETNWEVIAKKTKNEWKNEVNVAAEKMNIKRLKEDCMIKQNGILRQKTKTKTIIDKLDAPNYKGLVKKKCFLI